jgi:hypothetical protein
MNKFKEFQFAGIIFIIMLPVQILLSIVFIMQAGTKPMTFIPFLISNVTFVLIYLLFYGMTTTVDDERIIITYGIGLIRKTITLSEVKSVRVATSPWYYGWGIRFIPNGMLYNINGLDGVELTLSNRAGIIRIGSSDSNALRNTISNSIGSKSTLA